MHADLPDGAALTVGQPVEIAMPVRFTGFVLMNATFQPDGSSEATPLIQDSFAVTDGTLRYTLPSDAPTGAGTLRFEGQVTIAASDVKGMPPTNGGKPSVQATLELQSTSAHVTVAAAQP